MITRGSCHGTKAYIFLRYFHFVCHLHQDNIALVQTHLSSAVPSLLHSSSCSYRSWPLTPMCLKCEPGNPAVYEHVRATLEHRVKVHTSALPFCYFCQSGGWQRDSKVTQRALPFACRRWTPLYNLRECFGLHSHVFSRTEHGSMYHSTLKGKLYAEWARKPSSQHMQQETVCRDCKGELGPILPKH